MTDQPAYFQDAVLLIFARNPELGKVKTRLAQGIGNKAALEVYRHLLQHTRNTIAPLPLHAQVYYSQYIEQQDMWPEARFEKRVQQGANLGMRMQNAFAEAYAEGYKKVAVIGTDLLELEASHIEQAFEALSGQNQSVIGPASDGGFYLLALRQMVESLFTNQQWGTPKVLPETRHRLIKAGMPPYLLPELNDIDTLDDLSKSALANQYAV